MRIFMSVACLLTLAGPVAAQTIASAHLVVQRANAGPCERVAFSHDGLLLATDNKDEVLLWEVSSGRFLSAMKSYLSPEIKHMKTGGTLMASARAKGTLVFSPDDKIIAVLPVDFDTPLNFGPQGAPSSLWNVDTGLPLILSQWSLDENFARNDAAPATSEVETWLISGNRKGIAEQLEKGIRVQAISSDGSVGAARNDEPRSNQHIQLMDLKNGKVRRTLETSFNDVLGMALSPNGRYLAAHSSNRRFVTVWDTESGAELAQMKQTVQHSFVGDVAFSPDGKWLAAEFAQETVLFDTGTWKQVMSVPIISTSNVGHHLVFSPDSKLLARTGDQVDLVDVETGKVNQTVCSSPLPQLKLTSWAAQSGLLGTASSGFLKLWSSIPSALPETRKSERPIGAIAISPDGSVALGTRSESHDVKGVAYYEGEINLWPAKDQKAITVGSYRELPPFSGGSNSIDFSPDGKHLAAAMLDELPCDRKHREPECNTDNIPFVGLLTLWDTSNGQLLRKRRQPDPELNVVVFSPDGSRIATAQQDQIVKVYDAASLERQRAFVNPEKATHVSVTDFGTSALAFSPDGTLLLAGSRDGLVWLLDTSAYKPARILHQVEEFSPTKPNEGSSAPILSVFFSRDGKNAYALQSSGTIWKWNTISWNSESRYEVEPEAMSAVLSPDGKLIAVAGRDGALRFYSEGNGELKLLLASTADPSSFLAVATDGSYDFGTIRDLSLAAYRVGRTAVSIDNFPRAHRAPGLVGTVLKNAGTIPHFEITIRTAK